EQPEVEGDAWGSAHTAGGAAGSALVLGINSTQRSPAVSRSGASGAIQRGVEIGPEKTTAPLIPASALTSAVAAPSSSVKQAQPTLGEAEQVDSHPHKDALRIAKEEAVKAAEAAYSAYMAKAGLPDATAI
ncbi:unnamed protein product, partial [Pylaiella littoralis]